MNRRWKIKTEKTRNEETKKEKNKSKKDICKYKHKHTGRPAVGRNEGGSGPGWAWVGGEGVSKGVNGRLNGWTVMAPECDTPSPLNSSNRICRPSSSHFSSSFSCVSLNITIFFSSLFMLPFFLIPDPRCESPLVTFPNHLWLHYTICPNIS